MRSREFVTAQARRLMAAVAVFAAIGCVALPAATQASRAPVLNAKGEVLQWTSASRHRVYRLLTNIAGNRTITTVKGNRVAPPSVPGATVHYRVKAAYGESGWSDRVAITYPGGNEEEGEWPEEEELPEESEEPPAEEEEATGEEEEGVLQPPLWIGDPSEPILRNWANIAAEPGRITTEHLSSMPDGFAYVDELRDGDDPGGYGERAELGEGNPTVPGLEDRLFNEGEEHWIALPFMLGSDFPVNSNSWDVVMQVKQLGSLGTPILSMDVERGELILYNSNTNGDSSGNIPRWRGPVKLKQLNEILLHINFSQNPNVGWVELYGDLNGNGIQPLMGKTYMSTMKQVNGVTVRDQARIGQYRDASQKSGTSHVYYGRYVVAEDRAIAEAFAF